MHTVVPDVDRPDPELLRQFEGIPSSIASDVTGNVGFAMDSGIEPMYDGIDLAGSALTVKAAPGDNLIIHKAITLAGPGDVLVIDANGYVETGHVGELMCASCRAHGLAGLVIDGAIRDRADVEEMGFPVYARGVHPQGPLKQDPGSINVTVSVGGVTVEPGDVLVGDGDGVTVVQKDRAGEVLERSREKLEREAELREQVEGGAYLFDLGGYDELYESLDVVGPEDSAH